MIKGAIFDVDGTLLDSMPVWTNSGEIYLASLGIKAEPHLGDKLFSVTITQAAEYMKETYKVDKEIKEIIKGINSVVEDFYFNHPVLKAGALELLEGLKKAGVKMVVATSTDRYCIEKAFHNLGIGHFFERIFTCSEVGVSKGSPDIFFQAVETLGTKIEDTWVFEDGLYAMKTAKKEGFKIVGVYDEVSEKDQEDIKKISDIYLTDITEAVKWGHHFSSL